MFKPLALLAAFSLLAAGATQASFIRKRSLTPIIFDSDIGPDVDDAGTAAVLHALADQGEAHILAMACCTSSEWGAPCLDAINTWYGRPDIPIGTFKGAGFLTDSKYNEQIAKRFPNDLKSGKNAPDATEVYRKTLAAQKDRSVTICATGPLNNLQRLLESGPDRFSKLNGKELVKKKVASLVVMGGRFPEGKEWNFEQDARAAARVMADWPTPILASGFEIGAEIKTGARLHAETPAENPVRAAYELYVGAGKDRESWDQTAMYVAVRGLGTSARWMWNVSGNGAITVDEKTKVNRWAANPSNERFYLVPQAPTEVVKKAIEDLMVQPPLKDKTKIPGSAKPSQKSGE